MSERTDAYAELFFRDIPCGTVVMAAKDRVFSALAEEEKTCSFDKLVKKYSTLEELAALGGYSAEDVLTWQEGDVFDLKGTERWMSRRRIRTVVISAFAITALAEIYRVVKGCIIRSEVRLFDILLLLLSVAGAVFSVLSGEGGEKNVIYEARAYSYLQTLSDRYAKRSIVALALFFLFLAFDISAEGSRIRFSFFPEESLWGIIPLFCLIRNSLLLRDIMKRISLPDPTVLSVHILGVAVFSSLYWVAVFAVLTRLSEDSFSIFRKLAAIAFLLLIVAYNVTIRKSLTVKNIVIDRKRVAIITLAAVILVAFFSMDRDTWYMQSYINSVPYIPHNDNVIAYDEASGVFTITALRDEFKILHLTDIHLGGSLLSKGKDLAALRACFAEIAYTQPDLVIVTGDLCYPVGLSSFSFNNSAPIEQFAAFMRNIGIPWAFLYGNHDTERVAAKGAEEVCELYRSLSFRTSGTLMYPYSQPPITGRNNQLIVLRNADGGFNTALFLLDSNAYTEETGINHYDCIHEDQVDWYEREVVRLCEEEKKVISSLVFFHIPLQEYRTAYELYLQGDEQVKYYFGENNEQMFDKVCCSDKPCSLFERIVELGSTTGTFCGHDHYNNMSLEYQGVRLTYGMSIDYLVMPGISKDTAQRGGELITIRYDSSWDVRQIPLTSIK